MDCPRCHTALAPEDVRCARCGLVIGAEKGSQGVATWVWVLVGAGVLLMIVPCACAGLFLFGARMPVGVLEQFPGGSSSVSSSFSPDTPELAPLHDALRSWAEVHGDTPPTRLEDLLGTRADGRKWLAVDELPLDRHGNAYDYRQIILNDGWCVQVWTLGRDGQRGGEGEDADDRVFEATFTRQ